MIVREHQVPKGPQFTIEGNPGKTVLSVHTRKGRPVIYALYDATGKTSAIECLVIREGEQIDKKAIEGRSYLGTTFPKDEVSPIHIFIDEKALVD
jgi:hypothetical protein